MLFRKTKESNRKKCHSTPQVSDINLITIQVRKSVTAWCWLVSYRYLHTITSRQSLLDRKNDKNWIHWKENTRTQTQTVQSKPATLCSKIKYIRSQHKKHVCYDRTRLRQSFCYYYIHFLTKLINISILFHFHVISLNINNIKL